MPNRPQRKAAKVALEKLGGLEGSKGTKSKPAEAEASPDARTKRACGVTGQRDTEEVKSEGKISPGKRAAAGRARPAAAQDDEEDRVGRVEVARPKDEAGEPEPSGDKAKEEEASTAPLPEKVGYLAARPRPMLLVGFSTGL